MVNKKKAIIVGGSNGIGLAISKRLIEKGYSVHIIDVSEPDSVLRHEREKISFTYSNLLYFDSELFETLSKDKDVEVLMITAGFGRVADFEYLHEKEIENIIKVNTIAGIRILRTFYDRIKSEIPFYCGIMGSIAGFISSPMFSVYAASKAAICRLCESINIELEMSGTKNRILNVSPGSIKGTKFNGGKNDISQTKELANNIINKLLCSEVLYIPEYEEVYRGVLKRYNDDPHEFGISSYNYKKNSGRVCNEEKVRIGYMSGTFDLFHVGHLNILKKAKENCDFLIVGIHPDASHKGKITFIPFDERKAIVESVKYVDKVVESCREDSDAWKLWHYNRLFVGSDYKGTERFNKYEEYFVDKGVKIIYFPYTKGTSSTQIREAIDMKRVENSIE